MPQAASITDSLNGFRYQYLQPKSRPTDAACIRHNCHKDFRILEMRPNAKKNSGRFRSQSMEFMGKLLVHGSGSWLNGNESFAPQLVQGQS
jgi:hypothetical protein